MKVMSNTFPHDLSQVLPITPLNPHFNDMNRGDRVEKLLTGIETAIYNNSPTAAILLNKLRQELREQQVIG